MSFHTVILYDSVFNRKDLLSMNLKNKNKKTERSFCFFV
ncbi:hypothetical protein LEP1GSC108_4553 [Leptospira weilii str. UI 13098]|uniref:Uncharacterized protein n=1 Tax=Leptospira weilii str. UI 13098 TaxID=1088542 RepID=M6QK89_9LEPT|nr:hypothetical protein LEP1GSC108_4553 [Leptospira weilii str. UI 13098]